MLALMMPFNGEPATVGNGGMVGFKLPTREAVDRMHSTAISIGCKNEGAVGLRADDWYCGYFRDPEGNKLLAYSMAS
jgi:hypothetical protein